MLFFWSVSFYSDGLLLSYLPAADCGMLLYRSVQVQRSQKQGCGESINQSEPRVENSGLVQVPQSKGCRAWSSNVQGWEKKSAPDPGEWGERKKADGSRKNREGKGKRERELNHLSFVFLVYPILQPSDSAHPS